jgi:hypothetical protein
MFDKQVYINRRLSLRKKIRTGLILIPGNTESPMNYPKNTYRFRQDSNFLYFFDDNKNAIKIQIYCALIPNLLMTVVQKLLKRKWEFSNLVSFCKIHLFNYIHLLRFLEHPDRNWRKEQNNLVQLTLF